jgi:hypothetical protein
LWLDVGAKICVGSSFIVDWCGKEGDFPEIFVRKCYRFGAINILYRGRNSVPRWGRGTSHRVCQGILRRDFFLVEDDDARSAERTDADRRGRRFEGQIRPQISRRYTEDIKGFAASVCDTARCAASCLNCFKRNLRRRSINAMATRG